jgi:hypothetical protein
MRFGTLRPLGIKDKLKANEQSSLRIRNFLGESTKPKAFAIVRKCFGPKLSPGADDDNPAADRGHNLNFFNFIRYSY